MSKRTYYRRYRRTYPKQKWQSNVVNCDINLTSASLAASTFSAKHTVICQTPVPLNSAAGGVVASNNIIKTGNFKVKGTFFFSSASSGSAVSVIVYTVFVPQGISPDNSNVSNDNLATSIFYSHPEWVLGWTRVNMDSQGSDTFSISSRLKRNLNSGDSIQLGMLVINQVGGAINAGPVIRTTVQYAARAN